MPALAIRMSSRPCSATIRSVSSVTAALSRTSAVAALARPPASPMIRTVSSRSPGVASGYGTVASGAAMSQTTTLAPAAARATA